MGQDGMGRDGTHPPSGCRLLRAARHRPGGGAPGGRTPASPTCSAPTGQLPWRPPGAPRSQPTAGSWHRPLSSSSRSPAGTRTSATAPQDARLAEDPPDLQTHHPPGRASARGTALPLTLPRSKTCQGRLCPPSPATLPALTRSNFPKPSRRSQKYRPGRSRTTSGWRDRPAPHWLPAAAGRGGVERRGSGPVPLTFPLLRLISSLAGCNFQRFPQLPSSTGATGEAAARRGEEKLPPAASEATIR